MSTNTRKYATQMEVLEAIRDRLIALVPAYTSANCFILDQPIPPEFPVGREACTISPGQGAFVEAMFAGSLVGDGYNWLLDGWNGQTALAGGGPGLSAILLIEDGIAVIVLANHDEPGAEDVAGRLLQALM